MSLFRQLRKKHTRLFKVLKWWWPQPVVWWTWTSGGWASGWRAGSMHGRRGGFGGQGVVFLGWLLLWLLEWYTSQRLVHQGLFMASRWPWPIGPFAKDYQFSVKNGQFHSHSQKIYIILYIYMYTYLHEWLIFYGKSRWNTLPKTSSSPLKIGHESPKREPGSPWNRIHFQGRKCW